MNARNEQAMLSNTVASSLAPAGSSAPGSEGDESEPSDSSGGSNSNNSGSNRSGALSPEAEYPLLARARCLEAYADEAIKLACSLTDLSLLYSDCANMPRAAGKSPVEHAVECIWCLGLEHPESGLVPADSYDQIATLKFVNVWTMHILPALLCSQRTPPSAGLASLSKSIVSRRHAMGRRGPFWNGRSMSIAEIVVAPFADAILHSNGFIPDSPEYAAVSTWLAAIRAAIH
ncbi:hypothetical protein EV175_005492 [Coemansia sp. RSA 1933]|nr:hypothetical protein EV175_005492 [Coemansia sp. RSA 1933]